MMGNIVFVVSCNGDVDEVFTRRCKAETYIDKELAKDVRTQCCEFHIEVYELDPTESQYG